MKLLDYNGSEGNITLDFNELETPESNLVIGVCGVKPYTLYEDAYLMDEDYPSQKVFESDWGTSVILVEKEDYYKVVEPKHIIVANEDKVYTVGTEIRDFYQEDQWQRDLRSDFLSYVKSISSEDVDIEVFLDPV